MSGSEPRVHYAASDARWEVPLCGNPRAWQAIREVGVGAYATIAQAITCRRCRALLAAGRAGESWQLALARPQGDH